MLKNLLCGLLPILFLGPITRGGEAELLDVVKVWDKSPHNAFTDLIRFHDAWYLAFREGPQHAVPPTKDPGGTARILRSDDGKKWEPVANLDFGKGQDGRDPKLSITPDDRLMVLAAAAPQVRPNTRQSMVWFSKDGRSFGEPQDVGEPDWWLWRATWSPGKICYGIGYGPITTRPRTTRLYRSEDGVKFTVLIPQLTPEPGTGESTILFRKDGSAVALCRRDGTGTTNRVGTSSGDLTKWNFRDADGYLGGPMLLELPDGRIVAGGRYKGRTWLCWLDPKAGTLKPFLELPSGGDNSYPGLVFHDGLLWVSYYSQHEDKKCAIYLARVRIAAKS